MSDKLQMLMDTVDGSFSADEDANISGDYGTKLRKWSEN